MRSDGKRFSATVRRFSSRSAASGATPSRTSALQRSVTLQPRATFCATHSFHSWGSSVRAMRSWTATAGAGSAAADLGKRSQVQLLVRQREKEIDATRKRGERILERAALFVVISLHRGRIGHAPVRRERLRWPHRAGLCGRRIADRKDEIDLRRLRPGELVPAFRSQPGRGKPALCEQLERERIDSPVRLAAGAVRAVASTGGVGWGGGGAGGGRTPLRG